ncbi:hypothetical protein, partial [Streptacidiphilus melanogenes]|uniref:hypothetical protein n=1 Tax=Streptacidiphilus melanogenes TaxID=411235 RepID=UPI001F2A3D66
MDRWQAGEADGPGGQGGAKAGLSTRLVAGVVEQLEELVHSVEDLRVAAGLSLGRAEELRRMLSDC